MASKSRAGLQAPARHRSKALAGALALVGGLVGAHRRYLGSRFWWAYPLVAVPSIALALAADDWLHHPGFFVACLVAIGAAAEAIRFGLTPDAVWDRAYNASSGKSSRSGALPIWIAALALGLGAATLMSILSIAIEMAYRGAGVG